jgi:hypothetical protein
MSKAVIKPAKVVSVPSVATSAPKAPASAKPPKRNMSALFGGKRPRQAVSSVPTRSQAL